MRIGMTYDLQDDYLAQGFSMDQVAELDSPVTVAAIACELSRLGHEVERIGSLSALVRALANGQNWDLVFNIAEGIHGLGREAQIPAVLDAWNIPYTFSGPELLALTLHKGWTNAVVRSYGIATADFVIVHDECDLKRVALPFPLFAKPAAEGSSKGVTSRSLVHNHDELEAVCRDLLIQYGQPVLVETYLPGREFTVGLLGSGQQATIIGVMEVMGTQDGDVSAYTYANKQQWRQKVRYGLATGPVAVDVADLALNAWQSLGCLDAGRIDIRLDSQGTPCFIEVNPLAGLNPESSDLPILGRLVGLEYSQIIKRILDSALQRTSRGR